GPRTDCGVALNWEITPLPRARAFTTKDTKDTKKTLHNGKTRKLLKDCLRALRVLRGEKLWILVALAAALAGCATPGRTLLESPAPAACRTAGAPGGDPSPNQIRWIRPEASAERATLDDWCRSVGPAIVAAAPPLSDSDAGPAGLGVGRWHVHRRAGR